MVSVFSEEFSERVDLEEAREAKREKLGLELRDNSTRVKKYDRLKKRNKVKVCKVSSPFIFV